MKKNSIYLLLLSISLIFLQSCASIFGGDSYYALVEVKGHPNATIGYNGITKGSGTAIFKVKRKDANKLLLDIKQDNCPDYTAKFESRVLRGWAMVGSIITWTSVTSTGIPIPWGLGVDIASGAIWKPDTEEHGVSKSDHKHFNYLVEYEGCPTADSKPAAPAKSKADRLKELKDLLDKGILTPEEFNAEKKKILSND